MLNTRGVTAFVLKYRIVTKDRPGPLHPAPLEDAQRAIRLVRAKAKDYGIDPKRIGIWGFSAGGHLASSAATHFDAGGRNGDAIDKTELPAGLRHPRLPGHLDGRRRDARRLEEATCSATSRTRSWSN